MTEKQYSIRREILEWCQKNIKYPNYQNKDYNNPMNKLKEIKGINCRNGDVE